MSESFFPLWRNGPTRPATAQGTSIAEQVGALEQRVRDLRMSIRTQHVVLDRLEKSALYSQGGGPRVSSEGVAAEFTSLVSAAEMRLVNQCTEAMSGLSGLNAELQQAALARLGLLKKLLKTLDGLHERVDKMTEAVTGERG